MSNDANARRMALGLALLVALAVVLAYGPVSSHDWVRYDDDVYLLENPHVARGLDWEGLRWAFSFDGYAANYHPLTWLSHMLDVQCFGLRPGAHHLVNVALHALNGALALYVLRALLENVWAAAVGAALFALHPLRVESVAWAAERKDVLCAAFFLAATLAYVRYGRAPTTGRYALVVGLFALALLAKPMAVTFPCVALLLDFWPLRRFSGGGRSPLARSPSLAPTHPGEHAEEPRATFRYGVLLEKLPLFALAGLASLATVLVQSRGGATSGVGALALGVRALNALGAVGAYLGQSFWPARLSVFHPHAAILSREPVRELWGPALATGLVLLAALGLAWRLRRSTPVVLTGLLWFLGLLAPVIGIVQVGTQAHADRYTYLPSLGLVAALGGASVAFRARAVRATLLALGLIATCACTWLTRRQLAVWQDTRTLFAHALALEPRNYLALMKLGEVALAEGDEPRAREAFERSLAIHAGSPEALNNLALCHIQRGELDAARQLLQRALRIDPRDYGSWMNLGVVLLEQGDARAARVQFDKCLERRPTDAELFFNLGHLEQREGHGQAAERRYREALALRPNYAEAWSNLGQLLLATERVPDALAAFTRVVELAPLDPIAHFNLGIARRAGDDARGARASFARALELDPTLEPARQALQQAGPGG